MIPFSRKPVPFWLTIPVFRYILPFAGGIILSYYLPGNYWYYILSGSFILLLIGLLLSYHFPKFFGISFFIFWGSLGGMLYQYSLSENRDNFIGNHYQSGDLISVTLLEPLERKPKSWRSTGKVSKYDSSTRRWLPLSGKVIVYISKDSLDTKLGAGATLVVKKPLQPIKNSGNPGAFDYVSYAASNDWYYQVFLRHNEYLVSKKKLSVGWREFAFKARSHLLNTMRRYISDPQSLGVAQALVAGYRNDMDKEIAMQYAGTGVAHIIAISGLHLGIIQKGLLFLLSPLKRRKYGNEIMGISVIFFLWIFAFVSGASSSVLRAAFMFSLLLFGNVIGRKGNPYNTLGVSAFFLLLFQPGLLFNVGFQLSYSAVFSIFLFSQPITNVLKTGNKWVRKIWSMLSVTIAAQILTLPFVLYYFHQFPAYFLLANIVAIPLVWLALNLCLLLTLIFWWWPPVAAFIGQLVHLTISNMNLFIGKVDAMPFSRIEQISFSLPEAILLMAMLLLMALWILLANKNAAVGAIAILSGLIIYREWKWQQSGQQMKVIVYNIPGHSAIDFVSGHQTVFWGDSVCLSDPVIFRNQILPARTLFQIRESKHMFAGDSVFFQYKFGGRNILLLDKVPDVRLSGEIKTDILVLAATIKLFPDRLLQVISADTVIADGKLPFYRIKEWQIAADSLPLHFHSTAENGAFVLDLKRYNQ